jgi:two-component system, cell cycle sensor histidine kinase and response regulator CckA
VGAKITILVVEDEELIRKLAAHVLAQEGYQVLEASDPIEACDLFRYKDIDVLFTDVMMPCNNGADLARALVLRRPQTKVVFASGLPPGSLPETSQVNHVTFLQKPYGPQQLKAAIESALVE